MLLTTNPRGWVMYEVSSRCEKILVNTKSCSLFGFLEASIEKNMVKKRLQIETWGLFLILGIEG